MKQEPSQERNYLEIVTKGSFWNGFNFIILGLAGFITSVILTRYLGADRFGTYSYIVGLITAVSLLLDFGFGQAFHKYFPRYINDPDNRGIALNLFKKMTRFQTGACVVVTVLLWLSVSTWKPWLSSDISNETTIILLSITILIPAVLFKQITYFFSASYGFRDIALTNVFVQITTFIGIVVAVYWQFGLAAFIVIILINRIVGTVILFTVFERKFGRMTYEAQKVFDTKEFLRYTPLAYIDSVLQVVWSYSEIFFLDKYSTAREVGYYSLAFSLAGIITSFMSVLQRSVYNAQFELLELKKEYQSDIMAYMVAKYSSLIFLPVFTFTTITINTVVTVFYGTAYSKVALIFPFVLLGAIFAQISTPIFTKTSNSNRQFGTTIIISLVCAVINIALDITLIPKYASFGAGIASFTSQSLVVLAMTVYVFTVRRFSPVIYWTQIIKILFINGVISIGLFAIFTQLASPLFKIASLLLSLPIYYIALKQWRIFEPRDKEIIAATLRLSPRFIRPLIQEISKLISV